MRAPDLQEMTRTHTHTHTHTHTRPKPRVYASPLEGLAAPPACHVFSGEDRQEVLGIQVLQEEQTNQGRPPSKITSVVKTQKEKLATPSEQVYFLFPMVHQPFWFVNTANCAGLEQHFPPPPLTLGSFDLLIDPPLDRGEPRSVHPALRPWTRESVHSQSRCSLSGPRGKRWGRSRG